MTLDLVHWIDSEPKAPIKPALNSCDGPESLASGATKLTGRSGGHFAIAPDEIGRAIDRKKIDITAIQGKRRQRRRVSISSTKLVGR